MGEEKRGGRREERRARAKRWKGGRNVRSARGTRGRKELSLGMGSTNKCRVCVYTEQARARAFPECTKSYGVQQCRWLARPPLLLLALSSWGEPRESRKCHRAKEDQCGEAEPRRGQAVEKEGRRAIVWPRPGDANTWGDPSMKEKRKRKIRKRKRAGKKDRQRTRRILRISPDGATAPALGQVSNGGGGNPRQEREEIEKERGGERLLGVAPWRSCTRVASTMCPCYHVWLQCFNASTLQPSTLQPSTLQCYVDAGRWWPCH